MSHGKEEWKEKEGRKEVVGKGGGQGYKPDGICVARWTPGSSSESGVRCLLADPLLTVEQLWERLSDP